MNETAVEAAGAVLAAMGGAGAEAPSTPQVPEATVEGAEAPKPKAKKAKAPEAPKRPGPKSCEIKFPVNTSHRTKDGGEIIIAGTRISYLVKLGPNGRLKWMSSARVHGMVEAAA
jgi:hypothetical protein